MSGYIPTCWGMGNRARIPSIPNYAKAKEHYESVTPIRGSDNVRPLGTIRRYKWYQIQENKIVVEDGFLGKYVTTYSCILWHLANCVEYFPDGKIAIRTFGWHTPTTMAFINYSTRDFGILESVKGKWYWRQRHDNKLYYIETNKDRKDIGVNLVPDELGRMFVENPVKEQKYSMNRKAMNAVRLKYSAFSEYCRVMLSMDNSIYREEFDAVRNDLGLSYSIVGRFELRWDGRHEPSESRDKFFDKLDYSLNNGDVELMYSLAVYACAVIGHWSYNRQKLLCPPELFVKHWSELLKYKFSSELFVANEAEVGVGFKDPNKKYI